MLITQTPLRISFLGGGTDYPEYFEKYGGAVLGTAVDKNTPKKSDAKTEAPNSGVVVTPVR
jgi:galactokinase/mevalonate kinase-like predicted kinase